MPFSISFECFKRLLRTQCCIETKFVHLLRDCLSHPRIYGLTNFIQRVSEEYVLLFLDSTKEIVHKHTYWTMIRILEDFALSRPIYNLSTIKQMKA